jgi:hypothetical protein
VPGGGPVTGPGYLRVGTVLLNLAEVAAVKRHRNASDWSTVILVSGQTVHVHRPAAELIDDIGRVLRESGAR